MSLPALGLDISKLKFNACLVTAAGKLRHKLFPNDAAGFAQLAGWLARQDAPTAHACMEATGAYGAALALYLHARGHTVSVRQPGGRQSLRPEPALVHQDRQG